MDPILISVAFFLGLAIYQIGLPPLIGFLLAGFVLNGFGYESGPMLQMIGDLGVTLLLFTIGLKFKVQDLLHKEVWAGASLHLCAILVLNTIALYCFFHLELPLLDSFDIKTLALLGFALSFSSTVFAVKILEDKGQLASFYGRTAIGILIMQDLYAVLFIAASSGELPSIWALGLLGLYLLKPIIYKILDRAGHGELVVLYGIFLALSLGAGLFKFAGLKPDLGALLIGMLLANHAKATEMAKSLLNFKELLLVIFFLNIGLEAMPSWETIVMGMALLILLPLKIALYYGILLLFRLRARTALITSVTLGNYSEFGLIVTALGASMGLVNHDWVIAIALALSFSFVITAPLHAMVPSIYLRWKTALQKQERSPLHQEDRPIDPGNANIIILGMSRIGGGAYNYMNTYHQEKELLGIDLDHDNIDRNLILGHNVVQGDATDSDFWEKVCSQDTVELVMLAMPMHQGNLVATKRLQSSGFKGSIAAIASHEDQAQELKDMGVDVVFNIYSEAGTGFAEHVFDSHIRSHLIKPSQEKRSAERRKIDADTESSSK